MDKSRSKGVLERGAAADLWRNTLHHIPSVYGRLVYLTSLRNQNTGVYEHHGLALLFGELEADKALRKTHLDAFHEWLNYSIEQQKADLDLYISSIQGPRKNLIENWLRLSPHRSLAPSSAREVERTLFLSDLQALLSVLKNANGASSPDPDA